MHKTNPHSSDADKNWEMGRRDARRADARLANGLNVIEEARQYHINSMAKEQKRIQKDLLKIQQASFAKNLVSNSGQEQTGKPKGKSVGQIKTTAVKGSSQEIGASSESSFNSDQPTRELGTSTALQSRIKDFIGTVSKKTKPGARESFSEDADQLEGRKLVENKINITERLPGRATTSGIAWSDSRPATQSITEDKHKAVPPMSVPPKHTLQESSAKTSAGGTSTTNPLSPTAHHDKTNEEAHSRRFSMQSSNSSKASTAGKDDGKHGTLPAYHSRDEYRATAHSRQSSIAGPSTASTVETDSSKHSSLPSQRDRTDANSRAAILQAHSRQASIAGPSTTSAVEKDSSKHVTLPAQDETEEDRAALLEAIEYAKQTTGPHPSVKATGQGSVSNDMNMLTFDEEIYAPDGYIRTMHTMPSLEESLEKAKKARYIRHRVNPEWNKELTVSQIFHKTRESSPANPPVKEKPKSDSHEGIQ